MKKVLTSILPPILLVLYRSIMYRIKNQKDAKKKPIPNRFVSPQIMSYAQYQEDLLIDAILGSKRFGLYVDVGANDPTIISNTKRFYERGWRGINIEPNVELYKKLQIHRGKDINLNIGIGSVEGELLFYEMSADTLSSFDKQSALAGGKIHNAHLVRERKVKVLPLKQIFHSHLRKRRIDFLSIDVEGRDLDVLESNDWAAFRPVLIIVEMNTDYHRIVDFAEKVGYEFVFFNGTNGLFVDRLHRKRRPPPRKKRVFHQYTKRIQGNFE